MESRRLFNQQQLIMNKIPLIALLALCFTTNIQAQKYYTKTGETSFQASVETFEPVEAINKSTTAIFDTESGNIAVLVFINAFHFKIALMQEHFNENYMDTEKYPKASFKGQIDPIDWENKEAIMLKGTLKIKGVTQTVAAPIRLERQKDSILLQGSFTVNPSDFNIKIPKIVRDKISQKTKIEFRYAMVKK